MKQLELNTRIHLNQELLSSEIDGETIMMSVENGKYYGLNAVASRIWELVKEEPLFSEIIAQLTTEFNVDKTVCQNDTEDFILQLAENKLITFE